jgi:hypothetical protein
MDEPIDRALARAAEGPADRIDLDEVVATARRRGRRRRLAAGAGVVLLLVVAIPAMVVFGTAGGDDPQVVLDQPDGVVSPPPQEESVVGAGRAQAELELREEPIPRCGTVEWRVANHGDVDLSFGSHVQLERWDGDAWHEVPALPPGVVRGLPAFEVSAGDVGEWHELRLHWLDHVEPGWYRVINSVTTADDDEATLELSAVVEVVGDDRASDGICGPSAEELAELDPVDEGRADVTGDGNADAVALYAHDDGASVLVETAGGETAVARVDHGIGSDYAGLGSRGLAVDEVALDLTGDGRQDVLVRSEDDDSVDSLRVFAWDDGDLRQVHQAHQDRGRRLTEWTLRAGLSTDREERHWLECTDERVHYHRAGPIDDEDASFAHRTDTYRFSDGAAERLDQTEEHVDELPDEPFIDCDR